MPSRHIAIGDIHGCALEFEKLLEKLSPEPSDRIVLLGDLVNKGPDPSRVFALARACGAICLLGNHEYRLREYRHKRDLSVLKREDLPTLGKLSAQDWDTIEGMQLTHYAAELDTIFVHGGFLPHQNWREQPAEVVTRIQVIDRQGRPRKRSECDNGILWAERWAGPSYVVYGHTPREEVFQTEHSICLDTGCVLGGKLTALVLPEKKIVQVKARERYWGD